MAAETPAGMPSDSTLAAEVARQLAARGTMPGVSVGAANQPSPGGAVLNPAGAHPQVVHHPPPIPSVSNPFAAAPGGGAGAAPGGWSGGGYGATGQWSNPKVPPGGLGGFGGLSTSWAQTSAYDWAGMTPIYPSRARAWGGGSGGGVPPGGGGGGGGIPPGGAGAPPSGAGAPPGGGGGGGSSGGGGGLPPPPNIRDPFSGTPPPSPGRGYGAPGGRERGNYNDFDVSSFDLTDSASYRPWFPSIASERARHGRYIDSSGKTTDAFTVNRPFFREESVPSGVQFDRYMQHRDRAHIGHWQNIMAHGQGAANQYMSAGASSDLGMASSGMSGLSAFGMARANPYIAIPAMVAGAGLNIAGNATDFTHQKLMEQASLERARLQASNMGVDIGNNSALVTAGRGMGFRPSEATWMLKQYYGSIGSANAKDATNPLAAHLGGVDLGAQAFFQQGRGPGGGASGDVNKAMSESIGTGYEVLGLRDAKLSEYLSRIAAATEGMRERGLTLDQGSLNDFVAGLATSGKATGAFQGVRGVQVGMGLSNQAIGVSQGLMSPFRALGDAAILAQAAKEGGNAFEVHERIQKWSKDPRKIHAEMLKAGLNEDAMRNVFASGGATPEESKILARGEVPTGLAVDSSKVKGDVFSGKGAALGAIVAGMEQDVANSLKDLPGVLRDLTKVMERGALRQTTMGQAVGGSLGQFAEDFIEGVFSTSTGDAAVIPTAARWGAPGYEKLYSDW